MTYGVGHLFVRFFVRACMHACVHETTRRGLVSWFCFSVFLRMDGLSTHVR